MCVLSDTRFGRTLAVLLVTALLASFAPVTAPPAYAAGPTTYWVDYAAGSNTNPGTEAEPFETITYALSVAAAGDTVMIEPGLYEAANGEAFPLYSYGVSLKSTEGTATTIIDGGGTSTRLLLAEGPMTGVEIKGLTFRDSGTPSSGAAVMIHCSQETTAADSPRIVGNYFSDNSCFYPGGALFVFASGSTPFQPLIEDNVFVGNRSEMQGGAIELSTLTNAVVRGNTFLGNESGGNAGAIIAFATAGCDVLVEDNEFRSNTASNYGGAMTGSPAAGAKVRMVGNRFFDNEAWRGGALQLAGTGGLEVSRNDAGGNSAEQGGGFAWQSSAEVTSTNNAIGGNGSAVDGGAYYIDSGRFRATSDTVVDSQDATSAVFATSAADAELANCILWNEGMADVAGFDSVSYSDIRDTAAASKNGSAGPGNISADPLWLDDAAHKPDIGPGSPCIDAASPARAPANDFYGVTRPVDGDGDGVAKPDMGCCERTGTRSAMTFSAPSVCDYGSVKVAGTLKDHLNAALAYKPLTIQYSYNNFATVAGSKATTTNVFGAFTASFAPTRKTYYRAVYLGTDTQLGSRVTRSVLPRAYLPKPYSTSLQTYGKSYTLRGSLKPQHAAGSTVRIRAYRYSSGKYRYKKTYYAKLYNYEGYSKYRIKIRLPRSGRWAFRAYHPADSLNAKTYSAYRYVRVR